MKFIKTVSLPFDPILPKQPSACLYQDEEGEYYVEYDFGVRSIPLHIKGEDDLEAELNARTMLYIARAVARYDREYPPDLPPEYDRQLTEEMPAFVNWLDEYAPRTFQTD